MDCFTRCMELNNTQNPNNLLGKELTDSPYVLQVNKNNTRNEHYGVHRQPNSEDTDNSCERMQYENKRRTFYLLLGILTT